MNQVKMAKAIGISQGYLNQVLTGKRNISYTILNAIVQKFPSVNVQWIMKGEGKMFLNQIEPVQVNEPNRAAYVPEKDISLNDLPAIISVMQDQILEIKKRLSALENKCAIPDT